MKRLKDKISYIYYCFKQWLSNKKIDMNSVVMIEGKLYQVDRISINYRHNRASSVNVELIGVFDWFKNARIDYKKINKKGLKHG